MKGTISFWTILLMGAATVYIGDLSTAAIYITGAAIIGAMGGDD